MHKSSWSALLLVLLSVNIDGEIATKANAFSELPNSSTVAGLPNGIYRFCSTTYRDKCFSFYKVKDRVSGYFISADNEICVEGKVNNNTVSGRALDGPGPRSYSQPQKANPRSQGSILQEWEPGDGAFKIGRQTVFNLPMQMANTTRYAVWFKYDSALLSLNGYRQQDNPRNLQPPQKCQIKHPLTGQVL